MTHSWDLGRKPTTYLPTPPWRIRGWLKAVWEAAGNPWLTDWVTNWVLRSPHRPHERAQDLRALERELLKHVPPRDDLAAAGYGAC
jgi:hypothetical protein